MSPLGGLHLGNASDSVMLRSREGATNSDITKMLNQMEQDVK